MTATSGISKAYPLLIPYQIDFHTTTTGKHISLTKRHVRWRFGFVHLPSLISGETGVSCRGLELDIHLVWSIASGKYVVYLNNIPFCQNVIVSRMLNKFEHTFTLPESAFPGRHTVYIRVFATTVGLPVNQAQFSMTFDGQSYAAFYRIFEIGGVRMLDRFKVTLDRLVEKGLISISSSKEEEEDNRENANVGSSVYRGVGAGEFGNHHSHGVIAGSGITGNQGDSNDLLGVHDIVRGRNRYDPTKQNHKEGNTDAKQPSLLRSPSDPGLYELHQQHVQSGERTPHNYNQYHPHPHNNHQHQQSQNQRPSTVESGISHSQYLPGTTHQHQHRHPISAPRKSSPTQRHKSIPEADLIDFSATDSVVHTEDHSVGLIRSTSSVTMDTLLRDNIQHTPQQQQPPTPGGADDMSVSMMYSHIDPRQMYKTQQNLSFRLQNPPVYADTAAGDLIQPVYPQHNVREDGMNWPMQSSNGTSDDRTGVLGVAVGAQTSQMFVSPPAPTWDMLNMGFTDAAPHPPMYHKTQS